LEILPTDFERGIANEKSCSKIRASRALCASAQSLECETIFDQKRHDPASPPAIFTRSRSVGLLFIPPKEKSPQRKTFADVEEVKIKTAEALKRITLQEFQDCFEKW
jgi:hypothetical protein